MTSVLEPGFTDELHEPVGDWMPSRYTPSLTGTEDFRTEGDNLIAFATKHWAIPETIRATFDAWQKWLVRHVLERYPDDWPIEHLRGQLRFRQVVISMGRQNGKSLIAALFVLYFLCRHVRGPRVIGLASVDRQAKIVYDRVKYGIDKSEALSREIKTTSTRGITRRDGSGLYQTLPAKEESAQGEPASGGIYDELHLGLAALWDALVLAQRARRNSLLIGITTAGDDDSLLLIRLYREGQAAIDGDDERFGFFVWEGEDDELTEANVIRANPGIACGRIPLDIAMADARKMQADTSRGPDGMTGLQRVIRYTLNRFVQGTSDAWASLTAWNGTVDPDGRHDGDVVYGIERTSSWEYATITANTRNGSMVHTELVASLTDPDIDQLFEICKALAARGPCAFAMDSATLSALDKKLKEAGYESWRLGATEMQAAAQHTHAAIGRRAVTHPGDPLLRLQMARAKRRTLPEGWRLSRTLSVAEIDGVIATAVGVYVATVRDENTMQLF